MNYVFMDNFRGFSETIIPLRKANFLVGENSTGKSSFLSLFALFSTPQFWFSQDFSQGDFLNLGGFNDIVSVASANRNRFTVGLLNVFPKANKEERNLQCSFDLMTFRNEDGMPKLNRYIQFTEDQLLKIRFLRKETYYKLIDHVETFENEDNFLQFMLSIFYKDLIDRKDFKKLSKDTPPRVPLPILSAMIRLKDKPSKIRETSLRDYFPGLIDLTWLAPIRTKPRRTYDGFKTDFTPEGGVRWF